MGTIQKLDLLKTMLGISDNSEDSSLMAYLLAAEAEIKAWRWGNTPPESLPERFDMTQVQAVVNAYTQIGAEGELTHSENGISRSYKYTDMVDYIHKNVLSIARVI